MEEDKRKKKNRKIKNKQSKAVEDGVVGVEETATGDQNLVDNGKDEHSQPSEATNEPSTNVDSYEQRPNGKEHPVQVEGGKQQWLEREALSEGVIRKLRNENDMLIQKEAMSEERIRKLEENDMHIQKEAISGETIRKLKEEKDVHILQDDISEETIRNLKEENYVHIQKEALLEDTIRRLKEENDMHIQKEVTLEETINQLRAENDLQAHKQASLEMRIAQLQSEKDSLLEKEAGLEEKLLNETAVFSLKEESLEERINHLERDLSFYIEKEKLTKETMSNLNVHISRLQLQVAELEESRNSLLLENQQLKENVSDLQSTVQNLEKSGSSCSLNASAKDSASENEDLKSQIEVASLLVEKLVAENAELVEKVNELYVELDRRSAEVGFSGATGTDGLAEFSKPADVADPMSESLEMANSAKVAVPMPESLEIMSISAQKLNPLEEALVKDNGDTIDAEHASGVISSSSLVSEDSGEIVQIPLDDNEARNPELQAAKNVEQDAVPLTDAPLIGAPFRLISFVAKYVSGSDLINERSSNTSH